MAIMAITGITGTAITAAGIIAMVTATIAQAGIITDGTAVARDITTTTGAHATMAASEADVLRAAQEITRAVPGVVTLRMVEEMKVVHVVIPGEVTRRAVEELKVAPVAITGEVIHKPEEELKEAPVVTPGEAAHKMAEEVREAIKVVEGITILPEAEPMVLPAEEPVVPEASNTQ